MYDVCIIGGGAAGMICAAVAAQRGKSVCIAEKNPALGKKLYATGNGRCNISNINCENAGEVLAFFHSIGLEVTQEDEGRLYPSSMKAADVVFLLEKRLEILGVSVFTDHAADWISCDDDGFEISCGSRRIRAKKLVLACGGKASPQFGTAGEGYALCQALGHTVKKPVPVLTAIECSDDFSRLKGVRTEAFCRLLCKGKCVFEEAGEVQFTDYGLSGICIFNMSRYLLLDRETDFPDYEIELDLCGAAGRPAKIGDRRNIPGFYAEDILRSLLPQPLACEIIKRTGIDGQKAACDLSDDEVKRIEDVMHSFRTMVTGAKGWKMAQCTKGGVSLDEIDMESMQSKKVEGLFFAGEIIDYDGPCGGYNLQNAWETGLKAGRNV